MTEFLDYKKSILRLEKIAENLRMALGGGCDYELLPTLCFWLALRGEIKTLEKINSETINSPLAWDTETNLPSHPSLAADASSAAAHLDGENEKIKLILKSFSGWVKFNSEEILCACGGKGFTKRNVRYDIYLCHAVEKNNRGPVIKQMVAIMSADNGFLQRHFGWKTASKALQGAVIIYLSKNLIIVGAEERVEIKKIGLESACEFYDQSDLKSFEFGRRITEALKGWQ